MSDETSSPATYPTPPEPPVTPAAAAQEPPQMPPIPQVEPIVKKRRGRQKKVVAAEPTHVRVMPVHPYTINIYTQGIIIPPGRDAPVVLDNFVQAQIDARVLELS